MPRDIKFKTLLFVVSAFLLVLSSCIDESACDDMATVEVILKAGKGIESVKDAEVRICCVDAQGKMHAGITAARTADGHYTVSLPAGSSPADPFIEVSLGEAVYRCPSSVLCFEGGQRYTYSLVVSEDGLHQPGAGITVGDWSVVDSEIVLD